jgi:hypothetical protein
LDHLRPEGKKFSLKGGDAIVLEKFVNFAMEAYGQNIFLYGLIVLAVVFGCAAGLGAITDIVIHGRKAGKD